MNSSLHERLMTRLHAYGQDVHTSIRPIMQRDVRGLDTLNPMFHLFRASTLNGDTVLPGTKEFRGGPLLELNGGVDLNKTESITHTLGAGFWTQVDLGPKWSLALNARYWNSALPAFLDSVAVGTQSVLGNGYANQSGSGYTHYDIGGFINFSPNKFFDFSLGRGKHFFGEGYRSLFLSTNAYSYPYLRISTNVWKVKYVNLFSQLNDVRGAQGNPSDFAKKYSTMHYLSWNISKRINFSVFESIIWQSNDSDFERGFDINYLNPVIFYRPVEFSLGSPDNALLGFSFNVKIAKQHLLYAQLMFDEFLLSEIRAGDGWFGNKQAFQLGVLLHDVGGSQIDIRTELNYVRPFMYTHSDTRQNYAHHGEALAHPLGSNFWEWINQGTYRSGRLSVQNTFSIAQMGVDTGGFSFGNNIFRPEAERPDAQNTVFARDRGFFLLSPASRTVIQNELKADFLIVPVSGLSANVSYVLRSANGPLYGTQTHHWFSIGIVSYFSDANRFQTQRYSLP